MIMVCTQCQELLSDYIDGTLELGEQAHIERHLSDCEPCRAMRDDLLQIVHFSHRLPEHAPSAALWARIESDLAKEQPVGFKARAAAFWLRLRERHFNLSIPQMVAAAAAFVIVISVSVIAFRRDTVSTSNALAESMQVSPGQVQPLANPDMEQLEQQINQLSQTVEQKKNAWNPELRAAFERNLLYVNQSLVECRHQLSDNPSDDVSQELMLNAYREKIRLLEGFKSF
jgi:anti-sigma-K factor RskA